jgi:hypothetical protein
MADLQLKVSTRLKLIIKQVVANLRKQLVDQAKSPTPEEVSLEKRQFLTLWKSMDTTIQFWKRTL